MSTYKRHIVYLSDEEWEQLTRTAEKQKLTISAVVRGLIAWPPGTIYDEPPNPSKLPGGGIQARQAQRDDLLRKINRSK